MAKEVVEVMNELGALLVQTEQVQLIEELASDVKYLQQLSQQRQQEIKDMIEGIATSLPILLSASYLVLIC